MVCVQIRVARQRRGGGAWQRRPARRPGAPGGPARLRAAGWEGGCAYCNAGAGCAAWSYAYQWKASLINCWLLTGASGHSYKKGFVLGRRRSGPPTRTLAYAVPPPLFGGP